MNISDQQLEWIVQEVIRRLRALDGQPPAGGELRLSERLVTLATLRGRLSNVGRLIVPPRAIVTHAVRDELKQRQIELVRQ
jgi:hypothetical protein